jgi:glyoxalase family protein
MNVTGLHHITLICQQAQRAVDFYTRLLGLRLVKQTVNFDDPGSYHLYFGNETGAPGSAVTFFEWPLATRGSPGIGGTHHFALQVGDGAGLRQWKRYLTDRGLSVLGPLDRHYFESIYFNDPDGALIEIATVGPGWTRDEPAESLGETHREPPAELLTGNRDKARIAADTWPSPVDSILPTMALTRGMHHITAIAADIERTHRFLHGILGLRLVKRTNNFDDPKSRHWYWGVGAGAPGTLITYFERDPSKERPARIGAGQTHHYALAIGTEAEQLECRDRLLAAGIGVTPVLDRVYFKSIYTQDPDGHIVEVATEGPGFQVDESIGELGRSLRLPPWLDARREVIAAALVPIRRAV